MADIFEQGQRRIDDAGARAVGAADLLLDGADDVVAMARLFRNQLQHDKAEVALIEDAPPAAASAAMAVLGAFGKMAMRPSGFPVVAAVAAMSEGVHFNLFRYVKMQLRYI
jgi:hypothetical protein